MANKRADIRSAVKAMLDGNTSAGSNVYAQRETRLWESELPAILIFTNQEQATRESTISRRYVRSLELTVQVKVEATENVDEAVDSLVGEIEDIIGADSSLGGTVLGTVQTNTEISVDSDGEQDIGVGVVTFTCQYIS